MYQVLVDFCDSKPALDFHIFQRPDFQGIYDIVQKDVLHEIHTAIINRGKSQLEHIL